MSELVEQSLILRITEALNEHAGEGLKVVKEALGEEVSYGQIYFVKASSEM